ncbi:hypothetical protein PENSPDRAFT_640070 [Peniophora sp. CONT]|nr:hypothetical protein PENSPDRAFT_640070 [Peniophora sp. CONT]
MFSSFTAALALGTVAYALPSAVTPATPFGAVYIITNDLSDNYVVSAEIGHDGLLSDLSAFSAQGAGSEGRPTNLGALFSQSPVTVNQATGRLAVVNAGSNTVQLYNIDPTDPTQLTPIGEAVASGGDFPESLVFNNKGDKLCVLNGGLDSNVQCFLVDDYGALTPSSTGEITTYNQTQNPPMGPPGTASQVLFTPDQEGIIAIVKGLPANFTEYPGYMRVWPLDDEGILAETPLEIDLRPPFGGLTFSLSQIPGREAFVGSDVVPGAIVVDMTTGPANATVKPLNISNNVGNCWSVTAPKAGTYFISDLLADYVNEVALDDDLNPTLLRQYNVSGMGPNEAVVAEVNGVEYMYMLMEVVTAFGVWRIDGPGDATLVQLFDMSVPLAEVGVDTNYLLLSGMNIFVSPEAGAIEA